MPNSVFVDASMMHLHGILPLGSWGDNFIGLWGTLNFHLTLGGGLSQIGV